MSSLTKRVFVSFTPDQIVRLQKIAQRKGQSVAGLIRGAVEELYLRPEVADRLDAVRLMAEMRLPVADWEQMERESTEGYPIDARDPIR